MGKRKEGGGGEQGRREGEYNHTAHEDNNVSLSSSPMDLKKLSSVYTRILYTIIGHAATCPRLAVLLTQKLLHKYTYIQLMIKPSYIHNPAPHNLQRLNSQIVGLEHTSRLGVGGCRK